MAAADDTKFEFTKILEGVAGAEGPVFDTKGNFYMVAPEVEKNGKFAGQVLRVDLETEKVCWFTENPVKNRPKLWPTTISKVLFTLICLCFEFIIGSGAGTCTNLVIYEVPCLA